MGQVWTLGRRLLQRAGVHKIADESAKIAYFSFLSLFPLILILFALGGILGGEAAFDWVMEQLLSIMPAEAAEYLGRFVEDVTGVGRPDILSISLLFLLISASNAVVSLITGLNLIFAIGESRSWWRRNLIAVGTILAGTVFLILGVSWILGGPALMSRLGLGWIWANLSRPLVFFVLASLVWLAYRFLPNHANRPPGLTLAIGAVVATAMWALVTYGFRAYLASFDRFATLYGVVAGILVLLIWLYLSAFTVLFGGEVAATLALRARGEE